MSNEVKRKAIKISLLGDQNVGKTCICGSFLNLEFIVIDIKVQVSPLVEEFYLLQ